jgi:protein-S-isoprenylcysteine O-methyltransferase Ste14
MELIVDFLVSAVSLIVVGQYTWAGKGHFASDKMPRGALLISVVVLITTFLFLYLTWTQSQPLPAQIAGLGIQLFSWWLFWQAIGASKSAKLRLAFDEAGPRGLVTEGPYRYVRHPFYASYLIFWAGWTLGLWSVVALFPFAILIVIYVMAALMEERKFVGTPMAAEYEAYRQKTGFFWPKVPGAV